MLSWLQTIRSSRSVYYGLVLATCGQIGLATHSVLVEHSPGEHCEICVFQDRTDDAVFTAIAAFTADGYSDPVLPRISRPLHAVSSDVTRNRGPLFSSS